MHSKKYVLRAAALFFLLLPGPVSAMTIVALGDSTTAGNPGFRSPVEKPPAGQGNPESQYTYWLSKRAPGWKILNKGVGGETTGQILRRFDKDVLAEKPDRVIVMAGINDLYRGAEAQEVIKNLTAIYEKARENKIAAAACSILPYNDAGDRVLRNIKEVNVWIRNFSAENGMLFCDTYQAAEDPARPGKLAGSPDGLHPDVQTYKKMGEAVAEVLLKSQTT